MPLHPFKNLNIPPEKLTNYLLNPLHPVGRFKASWFANLGYSLDNWEELLADLIKITMGAEEYTVKHSPYGVKYEDKGELGLRGYRQAVVIVIWIEKGEYTSAALDHELHFVTAYPG